MCGVQRKAPIVIPDKGTPLNEKRSTDIEEVLYIDLVTRASHIKGFPAWAVKRKAPSRLNYLPGTKVCPHQINVDGFAGIAFQQSFDTSVSAGIYFVCFVYCT